MVKETIKVKLEEGALQEAVLIETFSILFTSTRSRPWSMTWFSEIKENSLWRTDSKVKTKAMDCQGKHLALEVNVYLNCDKCW